MYGVYSAPLDIIASGAGHSVYGFYSTPKSVEDLAGIQLSVCIQILNSRGCYGRRLFRAPHGWQRRHWYYNPLYKLTINSTSATDNLFQIATTTNQGLFVVNSNGRVGIGTSNPTGMLTVGSGQILAPSGSTAAPAYSFSSALGTGIYLTGTNVGFSKFTGNGNFGVIQTTAIVSGNSTGFAFNYGGDSSDAQFGTVTGVASNGTGLYFSDTGFGFAVGRGESSSWTDGGPATHKIFRHHPLTLSMLVSPVVQYFLRQLSLPAMPF